MTGLGSVRLGWNQCDWVGISVTGLGLGWNQCDWVGISVTGLVGISVTGLGSV